MVKKSINELFGNNAELKIFADCPAKPEDFYMDAYIAAGFNYYIMTEDYVPFLNKEKNGINPDYLEALEYLKSKGLKVLIRNHGNKPDYLKYALNPVSGLSDGYPEYFNNAGKSLQGLADGYYMCDEPSDSYVEWYNPAYSAYLDQLTGLVDWYNKYGQKTYFHINLLQSYGVEMVHGGSVSFEKYVDDFIDKILKKVNGPKSLSSDYYPLAAKDGKNFLKEGFLYDCMTIATKAKRLIEEGHDVYINYCLQAFYPNEGLFIRDLNAYEDFSFQTNVSLCLGAKTFEWYEWSYGKAGISQGEKYKFVKKANGEAQKLFKALSLFKWNGAMTFEGSEYSCSENAFGLIKDMEMKEFSVLKKIQCSSDTLVSEFHDEDDYAYMAVNYTEPSAKKSDTIEFTFDGFEQAIVYIEDKPEKVKFDGEKYIVTLKPGQAVFVYPL